MSNKANTSDIVLQTVRQSHTTTDQRQLGAPRIGKRVQVSAGAHHYISSLDRRHFLNPDFPPGFRNAFFHQYLLSLSDALISEAEYEFMIARAHVDSLFWADAQIALRRSVISTARAFLVPFGEAPEEDSEVFALLLIIAA